MRTCPITGVMCGCDEAQCPYRDNVDTEIDLLDEAFDEELNVRRQLDGLHPEGTKVNYLTKEYPECFQ
jgi:hypothetical protein